VLPDSVYFAFVVALGLLAVLAAELNERRKQDEHRRRMQGPPLDVSHLERQQRGRR
jgi:hypothetical protein